MKLNTISHFYYLSLVAGTQNHVILLNKDVQQKIFLFLFKLYRSNMIIKHNYVTEIAHFTKAFCYLWVSQRSRSH